MSSNDPEFSTKTDRLRDTTTTVVKWDPEIGKYVPIKEVIVKRGPPGGQRFTAKTSTVHRRNAQQRRAQKERLGARDGWRCFWCDCELSFTAPVETVNHTRNKGLPRYPTIDHLIELGNGGTHRETNCVLSCGPCNNARNRTYDDRSPDKR